MRHIKLFLAFAAGLLGLAAPSPAVAQASPERNWVQPPSARVVPLNGTCRMEAMPALPAGADRTPPAARSGFVWELGAYRCRSGRWEYIPGHWERGRANRAPNPLALIEVRQGRVSARPGYEIVVQGSGAVLRQTRGAGGLGALAVIRGEFRCGCDNSSNGGNCSVTSTGTAIHCLSQNCTGQCNMITTVPNPRGGAISYQIELPCQQGGGERLSRR